MSWLLVANFGRNPLIYTFPARCSNRRVAKQKQFEARLFSFAVSFLSVSSTSIEKWMKDFEYKHDELKATEIRRADSFQ